MQKPTIAIDIDDVIADQAEAFLEYCNRTWGSSYTLDDYTEHWMELWGVGIDEVERRADIYHGSGIFRTFKHKSEALPVLRELTKTYTLVLLTSRRSQVKDETIEWVNRHFPDIFSDVVFAGFFDNLLHKRWMLTKADICKDINAQYLIDDQVKHCFTAAEVGIASVLFGDYGWNQSDELPEGVTRCATWKEVERYFAARG